MTPPPSASAGLAETRYASSSAPTLPLIKKDTNSFGFLQDGFSKRAADAARRNDAGSGGQGQGGSSSSSSGKGGEKEGKKGGEAKK